MTPRPRGAVVTPVELLAMGELRYLSGHREEGTVVRAARARHGRIRSAALALD
jgi:hypothetical protein